MLVTLRLPVIDLRGFAANDEIARMPRLPPVWATEDNFVRGVGRLRYRHGQALEEWPSERMYADFARMVRFEPHAVEALNESWRHGRYTRLMRRMWQAIPESDALFDFDVLVPISNYSAWGQWRPSWAPPFTQSLEVMVESASRVAQLPVHVRTGLTGITADRPRTPLIDAGPHIAARFAHHTSKNDGARGAARDFIWSGVPALVVEAAGISPTVDIGGVTRFVHGDIAINAQHRYLSTSRRRFTVYVITAEDHSRHATARVRELRIHLLRLHSIRELLVCLTAEFGRARERLAVSQGPAYDRLQSTIRAALKAFNTGYVQGVDTSNLLSVAFFADKAISNYGFNYLERRLLGSARPALLRDFAAFAERERDRSVVDAVLKTSRDDSGKVTIYGDYYNMAKYDMRGANIGAAGDGASVNKLVQQGAFVVGTTLVDRFDLVTELRDLTRQLDAYLAKPNCFLDFLGETTETKVLVEEAKNLLLEAEVAARDNDPKKTGRALGQAKRWLFRFAESVGAAVTAAIIKHEAGL